LAEQMVLAEWARTDPAALLDLAVAGEP
jgi:hypothetical protein